MSSKSCKISIIAILGVICIVSGLVCLLVIPPYIKLSVEKSLPIENSSESLTFPKWAKLPIPIYTENYIFNITNVHQILHSGAAPIVQQVGPFVYREEREKVNIVWNKENNTVKYETVKRFFYEPEMSNGSLDDVIYHLNVPLVGAANTVIKSTNYFSKMAASLAINSAQAMTGSVLFPKHTIREMFFEGYSDPLIDLAKQMGADVPADKFGFYYNRNDTVLGGRFEIHTGSGGLEKLGQMVAWNNKTQLDIYKDSCNLLAETGAGDFQPPFADPRPEHIRMFVGTVCRSLKLNFEQEVSHYGVKGNRFAADASLFDWSLEENKCYCPKECPLNGVADISKCSNGAPVAISLPHFLYADKSYRTNVRGLSPDPKQHAFFIDIHPALGISLKVNIGMQINVVLTKDDSLGFLQNMTQPKITFPMIWFRGVGEVAPKVASELVFLDNMPIYIFVTGIILIVVGSILLSLILFFCGRSASSDQYKGTIHYNDSSARPVEMNGLMRKDVLENNNHARLY